LRPSVSALGIAPVFSPLLRPSPAASCLPLHLYNPVYTPSKGDALSLPLSPCCLPRSRCTAPFPGCRVIRTLPLFGMAPSASPLFSPHSASESPTARPIGNYCSVGVSAIHVPLSMCTLSRRASVGPAGPVKSRRIALCVIWPVNADASFFPLDLFPIGVSRTISASSPSTGSWRAR
jgi:hypothetical protein